MSSPSSGGSVGKRKRTSTGPFSKKLSTLDQLQNSSRDASGEDGESTAPETRETRSSSHKKNISVDSQNPPAKRLRSSTHDKVAFNGSDNARDPGEPSDTTEGSTDIANRVGKKGRKSISKGEEEKKEGEKKGEGVQEDNTSSMAPPPIGKLTDPVGYKTIPPPADRPVRVYADGVFDLFHLGYDDLKTMGIEAVTNSLADICDNSSKLRKHSQTFIYWLELQEMRKHTKERDLRFYPDKNEPRL